MGSTFVHSLQAALDGGAVASLGDGALLGRLAEGRTHRASVAFEAIVARHGPMVLAVCRRTLRDEHEAADAFQATFLVLAQRSEGLRDGDRLGGWLRGVAHRVALRVRASRRRGWSAAGVEPWGVDDEPERRELRTRVAAEVARLPVAYREAVRLCDLDGLTHEEAAARLGVAVGTVGSRVHRGRQILRRRLAGAGAASVALSASSTTRATMSTRFLDLALRAWTEPGAIPAAVCRPASQLIWRMTMTRWIGPAACLLAALGTAGAAARGRQPAIVPPPRTAVAAEAPDPALAERYRKLVGEWRALDVAHTRAFIFRDAAEAQRLDDDHPHALVRFSDKFLEIAESKPADPAARDSALWVMVQPWISDNARYPALNRAADVLIAHHADDPKVARECLILRLMASPVRDRLLRALAERATGRESKGTALLGLAKYLENQATIVEALRRTRPVVAFDAVTIFGEPSQVHQVLATKDAENDPYRRIYSPAESEAYKALDPAALRLEAEGLYQRVVESYADVVVTRGGGVLNLLTRLENQTLGDWARARLDPIRRLAPGRLAPSIESTDLAGRPMGLADYRGKLVVLVFWETWSQPDGLGRSGLAELAGRWPADRVAVLGVNTDGLASKATAALAAAKLAVPCWFDGGSGGERPGPIAARFDVAYNRPSARYVVVDERGAIRSRRHSPIDAAADVDAAIKARGVAERAEGRATR